MVLDAELTPLREKVAGLKAEEKAAHAAADAAHRATVVAGQTARHARQKVIEAKGRAKARAAAAEEAKDLPAQQAALAEAEARLAAAEAELDRLGHVVLAGAEGRIEKLRDTMCWYADESHYETTGEESSNVEVDWGEQARDAITEDDSIVAAAQKLPAEREAAKNAKAAAQMAIQAYRPAIRALEGKKALAEAPSGDEGAVEAEAKARADLAAATEAEATARATEERLQGEIATVTETGKAMALRREELLPLATRAISLASADAMVEVLTGQIADAESDILAATAALAALPTPAALMPVPDVTALEGQARTQAERVVERRGRLAGAEEALTKARAAVERIEALATERAQAEELLADWTRMGADLVLLAAAIVDSAGPELTAIANDLLHSCMGPRWTVLIETQRSSSDGKKTIEGCEVQVIDAEQGRQKDGEYLSGGEAAVINEAIGLAIAQKACEYWNVTGPTLIRDESGAAVSEELTPAYVAMLRKAAKQIGASRVLLVTHSRLAADLCDSTIEVVDGEVRVAA